MTIKKCLVLIVLLLMPAVSFAIDLLHDPGLTSKLDKNLSEIGALSAIPPGDNRGYAKARIVGDIDINLIEGVAEKIAIQLPNQLPLIALKRQDHVSIHLQKKGAIHSTWIGKIQNEQNSSVVLSTFRGYISGRISFKSKIYELKRNSVKDLEKGAYVIEEIDTETLPGCEAGTNPINGNRNSKQPPFFNNSTYEPSNNSAAEQNADTVTIDLLAVYTSAARIKYGSTGGIQAHIMASMDNANVAFANSGMGIQFDMVHMEEVSYSETDSSTDLSWVQADSTVASLRNTYNADMVSLITDSDYCGRGYVQRTPGPSFASLAFQVTDVDCALGNLTFAHEHGHNMGMEHDPANGATPANASYPYSFGHFVNGSYRTVMSYSSECTSGCSRAMYFSNPNVSYLGAATGIANQRYNAQTGINTAPIVAAFRVGNASKPAVSNPNPSNGATVSAGSSGQLLRVTAPGATSGIIYYGDDSSISFDTVATVNGDYLEATIPYTSGQMKDDGTNYWYVEATNASGTTRYPSSGNLSFTVTLQPTPLVVSNPNPSNGATVSAGSSGQLLRVTAPGATSGIIYYDDDSGISFDTVATVNGDYLEATIPYASGQMKNDGTNYWYVEATNASGTTRYPSSGNLSFTVTLQPIPQVVSNPNPSNGATVSAGSSGQLLSVTAPGAISGIIYYDDDSSISFNTTATINGDYLEAIIPYTSTQMNDNGTNYWYVEATNASGTTRYPSSGNLSFTVTPQSTPLVVSNPNPSNGATVSAESSGQLLRVTAPGATSGIIYYDDDSGISFNTTATINGDYLEATIPYTSAQMNNNGTNYWYVEATNASGTTRYPTSGNLSFTVFIVPDSFPWTMFMPAILSAVNN